MDLFGRKVAKLRQELEAVSSRAGERQDKVHELERLIDDLRGEVARLKKTGGSASETSAAQKALDEAMSIHGRSTR